MKRRALWVALALLVLVIAAGLVVVLTAASPPAIPHATAGDRAACTSCHSVNHLPNSHRDYTDGKCLTCHGT